MKSRRRMNAQDAMSRRASSFARRGICIPSGAKGRRYLSKIPTTVPERGHPERTAAEERYCLIALLKHLCEQHPEFFPLKAQRATAGGAPDFTLLTSGGRRIGVEHTNATEQHYQRWLATEDAPIAFIPSPGGAGWVGNEPERRFDAAVEEAVRRKLPDRFWRDAPSAERWLLIYENCNTGLFVSAEHGATLIQRLADAIAWPSGVSAIAFQRPKQMHLLEVAQ